MAIDEIAKALGIIMMEVNNNLVFTDIGVV